MSNSTPVVVITGTSTGFGRLTAEFLARRGFSVYATMRDTAGRNAETAQALRELAQKEQADLHVVEMDVTQDASVDRGVDEILDCGGRIDVLINNAGFVYVGLMESFTIDQAQRIFETNISHRQGSQWC